MVHVARNFIDIGVLYLRFQFNGDFIPLIEMKSWSELVPAQKGSVC